MSDDFIQARDGSFWLRDKRLALRGFCVGSWMNIENFMLRIPGTERRMRQSFAQIYGEENANRFFDDFLESFLAEDDFALLRDLGVNTLRLPFSYRHFEDDQKPGVYKEEGFRHLDRALELCRRYGLYAILDLHSTPGGQNPDSHGGGESGTSAFWEDAAARQRIIDLWAHVARRYARETIIAGYDLLNEPAYVTDKKAFNAFFDQVIAGVREVDANHVLFLEGDDWAKDFGLFTSLAGHQLAISFHFYPGQHVPLDMARQSRTAELEHRVSYFTNLREKTGLPLWVGETGGHFPRHRRAEGLSLVKDFLDILEARSISWTLWTYKDAGAMGMVYPREDTPWAALADRFRRQWQTKERGGPELAREIFRMLERRLDIVVGEKLKEELKFRIFALLNELHIHHILLPALQSISWERMREHPQSFRLENCEGWGELAELVKSYTSVAANLQR